MNPTSLTFDGGIVAENPTSLWNHSLLILFNPSLIAFEPFWVISLNCQGSQFVLKSLFVMLLNYFWVCRGIFLSHFREFGSCNSVSTFNSFNCFGMFYYSFLENQFCKKSTNCTMFSVNRDVHWWFFNKAETKIYNDGHKCIVIVWIVVLLILCLALHQYQG